MALKLPNFYEGSARSMLNVLYALANIPRNVCFSGTVGVLCDDGNSYKDSIIV